jgi:cell wall assembly regulator SMI1
MFPGFDPSKMDPQYMAKVAKAFQRLPRGQMQQLQTLIQKAMSGKDITREAAAMERMLPPELKELLKGAPGMEGMGGAPGMGGGDHAIPVESTPVEEEDLEMSADQAKKLVEQAAKEGKISQAEAEELLSEASEADEDQTTEEKSGGWKRFFGKKKD